MKQIISALIKAQAKIGAATKDATNSHFKNKYATLESVIQAIKEPLLSEKITIVHTQGPEDTLVTSLYHDSGECIQTSLKLILDRQNMQSLGSALSYAKRYNLTSLLNLPTEDDDGNSASLDNKQKPIDVKKENVNPPQSLGSYIMKCGNQNVKGKKLIDIANDHLEASIKYFRDLNKPLTGDVKESVEYAEAYLNKIKTKAEPKLDETEKLPF